MPIVGRLRCSSWRPTAIAASPMTVVAMAARASPGTATTWIPTLMTSRLSWKCSTSNARLCRLLRGWWRSHPLYRSPRHETSGKSGADLRSPAADAEDGGQSRRPANEGLRRNPRRLRRRPIAILQGPRKRAVLRLQPAGREGLPGYDRLVLGPGYAGRHRNTFDCIKAFSETDFTEDLKKFDVPTLIVHGDDDQLVPIGAAALASSKLVKNATLKVYAGAPHGLTETHKEQPQCRPAGIPQGLRSSDSG